MTNHCFGRSVCCFQSHTCFFHVVHSIGLVCSFWIDSTNQTNGNNCRTHLYHYITNMIDLVHIQASHIVCTEIILLAVRKLQHKQLPGHQSNSVLIVVVLGYEICWICVFVRPIAASKFLIEKMVWQCPVVACLDNVHF